MKVVLDAEKVITSATPEQLKVIKDDLMIKNPAYASAKAYSRYSYVAVPPYISYFKEFKDSLTIPIGYEIPFDYDLVNDLRQDVKVDYPKIKIELRDSQVLAYESYIKDTDKGMFSMPTGKGKSILGIYLAYTLKQKCLVIVHKDDLVRGWKKDIEMCFDHEVKSGLIKAKSRKVGEQITIATIQTLSRMSEEELSNYTRQFGMLIADEFHHVPANTYGVISKFSCPYKIGLSATPERSDGLDKVMNFYLGDFAYIHEEDEDDKDILPVEVFCRVSKAKHIPLVVLDKRNGKYKIPKTKEEMSLSVPIDTVPYKDRPRISYHTIDKAVIENDTYKKEYLNDIISEYNNKCSIIIFLNQKESCKFVQDELIARGIHEEYIQLYYGDLNKDEREKVLKRAETERDLITIATYSIATEGTNIRNWEIAFLLSSINNGKNCEQAIGRCRRRKENKIPVVRVYDYSLPNVYTMRKHFKTREIRYKKLGFKLNRETQPLFSRGYKK